MSKSWVIFALLPTVAFAQGVESTNGMIGAGVARSRFVDSGSLFASVRAPLFGPFGGSLDASGGHSNSRNNDFRFDNWAFGGSIFAQNQDVGRIGFGYHRSGLSGKGNLYSPEIKDNNYSLSGSYFVGDFNLSASRDLAVPSTELVGRVNSWTGSVTWFGLDRGNLAVTGLARGMDFVDNYGVGLAFQPQMFNRSISLGIQYSWAPHQDAFSLNINYYFGSPVSLKTRSRRY